MSRRRTAALASLAALLIAAIAAAGARAEALDLAARAAGATRRCSLQGPARRPRRPQLLGSQPRSDDRRGQQHDARGDLQLGRRELAPARDRLRRTRRHRADRVGRPDRVLDGQRSRACRAPSSGLALCHFKDGEVVAVYSTGSESSADPLPRDGCGRLRRPGRLLVRRRRRTGRRSASVSAPSICTGTALT